MLQRSLEEVWGCTAFSQLGRQGAIGGTQEQQSADSLWCLAPWKSTKDKGTEINSWSGFLLKKAPGHFVDNYFHHF